LLAASPLFMLGTLYQLIAQVGGLGLLLAATAFLTARLPKSRRQMIPHIVALAIMGSAVAIFYPEVSSFSVSTTMLVLLVEWWRGLRSLPRPSGDSIAQKLGREWRPLLASFPLRRIHLIFYGSIGAIVILRYNVLAYIFTHIL